MRERIKSIILFILVLNSLILTSLLNFYNFNDNTISLSEYYPRIKFGEELEINQIIKPNEIIIHFGDNSHTVIRNDNNLYNIVLEEIRNWTFYNITIVEELISWDEIYKSKIGIELIFSNPLIFTELSTIFEVNNSNKGLVDINRLLIFVENENVYAYFISDNTDKAYICKVLTTDQLLNSYISEAKAELTYSSYTSYSEYEDKIIEQMYYLPNEGLEIERINLTYTSLSEKDLIQMLFIDPNSVRNVYEQDIKRIVLYTDGISSLQHNISERYITYYQPIIEQVNQFNIEKDLNSAVKFINQHGGWDGTYLLEYAERKYEEDRTEIMFRKYIKGIPIYEEEGFYGFIRVKIYDETISLFQRSIIFADNMEANSSKTMSGQELLKILNSKGISEKDIRNIKLIYKTTRIKNNIILNPFWLIETKNNDLIEMPATN